jgi:hypothetical protein
MSWNRLAGWDDLPDAASLLRRAHEFQAFAARLDPQMRCTDVCGDSGDAPLAALVRETAADRCLFVSPKFSTPLTTDSTD